ncbi:hypothetical protein IDH44_14285 [Paenibacillus sp. IB182496]|uniref:Uncharacterized protein n=1 Tax=Paenibacillus sabuli TaxID=2772509 RepID=A0A927BVR8_9BACL|nr:hypothetical protein [Paenibacillus sabuli]MBD2846369.1 hypothetical protein [Paenibacillus sabuli]
MVSDLGTALMLRKLTAIYFATATIALVLTATSEGGSLYAASASESASTLLSAATVYGMYAGAILFLYGTPVSLALDAATWRLKRRRPAMPDGAADRYGRDALYIALHGVLGALPGWTFGSQWFALYGMLAAVLYGLAERWTRRRLARGRGIKCIWLTPVLLYAGLLLVLLALD